jgi:aminotransferase
MMDYTSLLSPVVRSLKPSGIRKFFDLVDDMKDPEVISLGVGQPDFVTPWHIREAGIDSLTSGRTFYTSNAGIPELRREICAYLARRFGLNYSPEDETIVTVGASEAIDICVRALVSPGDEVIIPEPSFVCYEPIVRMARGTPVIVPTKAENEFRLTAAELRAALTERTRLLILPFPNNPTGAILRKEDLEALAAVLRDTRVMVLSDEIYGELTYDGGHVSIASLPGMAERTIVVNGFSKAYAMTGWRLGYACGPAPVIEQMNKIHQYAIMCAPITAQDAAIKALRDGDDDIRYMVSQYDARRRYLLDSLRKLGITCFEPLGAFYVFPSIKRFGLSSEAFCERLLTERKLAVIPGNAFGESGEGFVRISYAYSIDNIERALERLRLFVENWPCK